MKIKLATRQSELALFQANYVMNKIQTQHAEVEVELVPMTSEGDQTEKPLHEIGGKGLFVTKLESAFQNIHTKPESEIGLKIKTSVHISREIISTRRIRANCSSIRPNKSLPRHSRRSHIVTALMELLSLATT